MELGTGVPLTLPADRLAQLRSQLLPGLRPEPGNAAHANVFDQNAARPARQLQFSIGLQREIYRDLVVEASYVGNTGVWWTAPAAVNYNSLQPATLNSLGININNPTDVTLLNSQAGIGGCDGSQLWPAVHRLPVECNLSSGAAALSAIQRRSRPAIRATGDHLVQLAASQGDQATLARDRLHLRVYIPEES